MAYFERLDGDRFLATEHVGGAWELSEQHIAPALGLLVHCVELDRDRRRDDDLQLVRVSHDILGTVPVAEVAVQVRVTRPGRTIELVEAVLSHAGRAVVVTRAWLLQRHDTAALAGTPLPSIPAPHELPAWDAGAVWPGGFIRSAEVRRAQDEPGRARFWARTDVPLVDEPVSDLARLCGLLDIANGMTVRVDPRDVAFPNVDLTAHLFRAPQGEWLGCDTSVSFGPTGLGLTTSVLHDVSGPFGTLNQALTVRPGPEPSRS
ncbi:thioesterase family protein [Angustibacter sp. Root456]|uniref:thioesterase family protein n=1 Tax=Angustibacter sp. Root456 TaxID=1736539 RepID=UPI0006F36D36|nr:thioesterase family protein [Angustibacter sp. Root456]KQX64528.1 thioesterase [Angustibacter sp. Root456]